MPQYILLPDQPGAGPNQPQIIVLKQGDDNPKSIKKMSKDERAFRKFMKMKEEEDKKKAEKEKKDAEKNKPRTFTFLEVWGMMTISAIPLSITLLLALSWVKHAFEGLMK